MTHIPPICVQPTTSMRIHVVVRGQGCAGLATERVHMTTCTMLEGCSLENRWRSHGRSHAVIRDLSPRRNPCASALILLGKPRRAASRACSCSSPPPPLREGGFRSRFIHIHTLSPLPPFLPESFAGRAYAGSWCHCNAACSPLDGAVPSIPFRTRGTSEKKLPV